MKSLIHFGPNFSPAAYDGTAPAGAILFVAHEFRAAPDGCLLHSIDGSLVATVPPEGQADYAAAWPACDQVVRELAGAESSAAATLKRPAAKKKSRKGARR